MKVGQNPVGNKMDSEQSARPSPALGGIELHPPGSGLCI